MNKILLSLGTIALVAIVGIGGTVAYFTDTETSTGNTFTAGTLDLQVAANGGSFVSTPVTLATVSNMQPGQETTPYTLGFKNNGTIDGKVKISVDYTEADGAGDDSTGNEYSKANDPANNLTANQFAKLLIVTSATTDGARVEYWYARQIIAEKYTDAPDAISKGAIVSVAGTSPDPTFNSGANYAPTVYGMKQVSAFYLKNTMNGSAVPLVQNALHSTGLTVKLSENADNKAQFDGVNITLTATMSQLTDPVW
jgi:predicted ribosomally synthesized peptide with SipW-like signal peptide